MNEQIAIFAGGCFWCMVKPFDQWPGIHTVKAGYTGGDTPSPTYEEVCTGNTNHYEAVRIAFDATIMPYTELLKIYFQNIDPTDGYGQFADRGTTYEPAIFYTTEEQQQLALAYIDFLTATNHYAKAIAVKVLPAKPFYEAESYHQDYHTKNKLRYNLYHKNSGRKKYIEENNLFPEQSKEILQNILTPIQYHVTQENGTEQPYTNPYDNHFEPGIYVDIVSGKPLFSSTDKFQSGCGWPAFSKPIIDAALYEKHDTTHGMTRTEVRSTSANSHLGHVFTDGKPELGGLRYCINSASLRFIPLAEMEQEGYGAYISLVSQPDS